MTQESEELIRSIRFTVPCKIGTNVNFTWKWNPLILSY